MSAAALAIKALPIALHLLDMALLRMSRSGVADLALTRHVTALKKMIEEDRNPTKAEWDEMNEEIQKKLDLLRS